uniref:Uncharacterized protein n=1 Tax=Tanacetum cinerariifolium TaxID=118510 RepID=A0A6L2KEQ6_TANCI|nr:hypothetical protein [Tanacetum cinerariifolium]
MNHIAPQQAALDNALVPSEKRLKIERCNARIAFSKPQKEETYQVTLDALKLSPCYPAFQITAEVLEIYMHQFWNTFKKIGKTDGYNFKLDKKKYRVDTEFVSKTKYYHKYGALRPDGKKVQEPACLKHKTVSASPKEPTQKGKRVKRAAKKATTALTTDVVIKDTPGKSVSKKKAPVKTDRGNRIELLSDAALLEDAQMKETLKKSKQETYKLQASGSSKGADFESEIPDEQASKTKDTSEGTGDSEDESDDVYDEDDNDDDDDSGNDDDGGNATQDSEQTDSDDDENPSFTLKDYEEYVLTPERDKSKDEDKMYEEEDDDVAKELKLLNLDDPSLDINSLMNTSTVPPLPPPVNPSSHPTTIPQQQTPDFTTTTTTYPTMTLLEIPNFASWVYSLETKVSEFNQTSQIAEAISSVSGIVDNYLASKLKEEVNVAVRLQSNKLKEEAEAENQEFINQTSYAVAASLSEFELKKIPIDKMETNGSINRSDIQRNLYNAMVESYNTNKDILSTYGDVATLKKGRDDQDKDEDPSAGSDLTTKRIKLSKYVEPSKGSKSKESKSSRSSKGTQSQPKSSGRSTQPEEPKFEAANTEIPPKNGSAPMPKNVTKKNNLLAFPADYFINNDLEYLKGVSSSSKYATFTTRTKAAKYDNIRGIEDMVLTLWSPVKVAYNKHLVLGTYHWGLKQQRFYAYACHWKSPHDVYSKRRIIAVTSVKVIRWYDYRYLEEIVVQRDDNVLYKFKEGNFPRLNLRDIKDMLLLLVQKKLSNLDVDDRMEIDYLPKRHWSNLEKKRSRIMIKAIDKLLFKRRLMHNLEKFVGRRDYGNDLRLLEQII